MKKRNISKFFGSIYKFNSSKTYQQDGEVLSKYEKQDVADQIYEYISMINKKISKIAHDDNISAFVQKWFSCIDDKGYIDSNKVNLIYDYNNISRDFLIKCIKHFYAINPIDGLYINISFLSLIASFKEDIINDLYKDSDIKELIDNNIIMCIIKYSLLTNITDQLSVVIKRIAQILNIDFTQDVFKQNIYIGFAKLLHKSNTKECINNFIDIFNIDINDPKIQDIIKLSFIDSIRSGFYKFDIAILLKDFLPDEFLNSKQITRFILNTFRLIVRLKHTV